MVRTTRNKYLKRLMAYTRHNYMRPEYMSDALNRLVSIRWGRPCQGKFKLTGGNAYNRKTSFALEVGPSVRERRARQVPDCYNN